jgi:hypothetical protein
MRWWNEKKNISWSSLGAAFTRANSRAHSSAKLLRCPNILRVVCHIYISRVQFMCTCIFYFASLSHSDSLAGRSRLRERKDRVRRGHAPIIMPEQPARVIRTTCWSNKWRTATGYLMGPKEQRFAAHECFVAFVRKTASHSRSRRVLSRLAGRRRERERAREREGQFIHKTPAERLGTSIKYGNTYTSADKKKWRIQPS